jgi:MFS family permease
MRAVSMVYASTTIIWASYAVLFVVLPFRFENLGLSVVQYGIAIGIFAFGMLSTESVWGVLAFRLANPRMIVLLGAVVTLLYIGIGFSTSYLLLAVLLGSFGALMIFQAPLTRWMALTAMGPGTGGRGAGIYGIFSGAGLVLGTAIGPLLLGAVGFTNLALLAGAIWVVGVGVTVVLPWSQVSLPSWQPGFVRHVRDAFSSPFALVTCLVVLAFISKALVLSFLQYYSVDLFHGTPSEAGFVIGVAQATSLVAGAALGVVVDRWGAGRSTPFGFVLVTLGAAGTLFSVTYGEMVGATVVQSIGLGWLAASLLPLALGPIPPHLQGTAVGVFGTFEDLGLLAGPILIGAVYASYGARSVFVMVGALAAVGVLLSLLVRQVLSSHPSSTTTRAPLRS